MAKMLRRIFRSRRAVYDDKEDGRGERVVRPEQNFGQPQANGIVKTIKLPSPKEAFCVALTGIVVE